ncbi:unnamed protein product [Ectocarpus sp. CCAP 1310/34]|nr:unnamed protein product [Ectocarpus sp. CCAP 1310/34]
MNLKIILFQLPSHTSHITQPLDVVAFGRLKKSVTRVLASFYPNSGGLAMNLKIILFQLPSHTSHITQPLDVVAFGRLKKSVTRVLASFYPNSGGLLPLKRDMPGVIADAWKLSFTPEVNK